MSYLQLIWTFVVVDLLAATTPGPNSLLVIQLAFSSGRRRAVSAVTGFVVGNVLWALATLVGLVAIFQLVPPLYLALKIAGGAYLVFLGVQLWRTPAATLEGSTRSAAIAADDGFLRGLTTTLLNPKCAVYFASVFTVFLKPDAPAWVPAVLIAIVASNTMLWYGALALVFSSPRARRFENAITSGVNRVAGAVLVAFGVRLVLVDE
jgi:RhtB (resistance to homoserine/threonine) family protein